MRPPDAFTRSWVARHEGLWGALRESLVLRKLRLSRLSATYEPRWPDQRRYAHAQEMLCTSISHSAMPVQHPNSRTTPYHPALCHAMFARSKNTMTGLDFLLASHRSFATLARPARCRGQGLHPHIALISHHLAGAFRRLVDGRWDIGTCVCRRRRRIVLHLVTVGRRVLLVLRICALWTAHESLHHPSVVREWWQTFTQATSGMQVPADEEQQDRSKYQSNDGVPDGHSRLRKVSALKGGMPSLQEIIPGTTTNPLRIRSHRHRRRSHHHRRRSHCQMCCLPAASIIRGL